MSSFIGTTLESRLCMPAEGGGEGCVDGSTRKRISEQRETLRGSVLTKALELYVDQTARPVLVWPQKRQMVTVFTWASYWAIIPNFQ